MSALRRHPVVTTLVALPLAMALACAGLVAAWLHGTAIPFASGARYLEVVRTASADYTPRPGAPVFILAVGSDARPGETTARGDALHLIGVNPTTGAATILDIPRDTGANIPGHGTDKINASMSAGGLPLLAQTVGQMVGVPVQYAVATDFQGFTDMVDELGGVTVNVVDRNVDGYSGANFEPGVHHLDGAQSLSFNRNRHGFPTGDLKRSENQGYFIVQALGQLRAQNPGPVGTLKLLGVLGRHTRLEGVGLGDLYELGRLGLSIDPANVRNQLIPVGSGTGTRLALQPSAAGLFADFADDAVLQQH